MGFFYLTDCRKHSISLPDGGVKEISIKSCNIVEEMYILTATPFGLYNITLHDGPACLDNVTSLEISISGTMVDLANSHGRNIHKQSGSYKMLRRNKDCPV